MPKSPFGECNATPGCDRAQNRPGPCRDAFLGPPAGRRAPLGAGLEARRHHELRGARREAGTRSLSSPRARSALGRARSSNDSRSQRLRGAWPDRFGPCQETLARSRLVASRASWRSQRSCGRDRGPTRLRSPLGSGPPGSSRTAGSGARGDPARPRRALAPGSVRDRESSPPYAATPFAPSPMTTQTGGAARTMDRFGQSRCSARTRPQLRHRRLKARAARLQQPGGAARLGPASRSGSVDGSRERGRARA